MSYANAAKELKKNIQIMSSTFERNNLQVLNVACKPYGNNDADLRLFVEIASIEGDTIPADLNLKVNLYDADGDLYLLESSYLDSDSFQGYDTIEISCYDSGHTLDIARTGRLYVTLQ